MLSIFLCLASSRAASFSAIITNFIIIEFDTIKKSLSNRASQANFHKGIPLVRIVSVKLHAYILDLPYDLIH